MYKRLTKEYQYDCNLCKSRQCTTDKFCIDRVDCNLYNRLAELEDKFENGTLVELPCKVGDTVWCLIAQGRLGTIYTTGEAIPRKVNRIILDGHKVEIYTKRLNYYSNGNDNGCNYYGYFDETVFLTKAEAEQRLKELQNER